MGKTLGVKTFDYLTRGNPFRVMASEDNTSVFFDGTLVATLNAGQIYPAAFTAQPQVIFKPKMLQLINPFDYPVCTG
ncbi:MAG: hypothetical protein IPI54_10615 [Chitinophagaceae bacterium]|nr:hypothetical protein [Chitinophagaceae bacterium]